MRKAFFSGSFYSSHSDQLEKQLKTFFNRFNQSISITSKPCALIVPHAGYIYSGQIAAAAFSQIKKYNYKTIIILGPSHRFSFNGISIDIENSFETPFGSIPINTELADLLRADSELVNYWQQAHLNEHSIEVECPFIYHLFQDTVPIIPIVVGQLDLEQLKSFSKTLIKYIDNKDTLIVISTDFSHFYDAKTAERMDNKAMTYIHAFDFNGLWESQNYGETELCGIGPTMILGELLKHSGVSSSQSLMYGHSGAVSGDDSSVVGYHSAVFG